MKIGIDVNVDHGDKTHHIIGDIDIPAIDPRKVDRLLDRLIAALDSFEAAADAQRFLADAQRGAVKDSLDALKTIAGVDGSLAKG